MEENQQNIMSGRFEDEAAEATGVAVIVGASSGIGYHTALKLLSTGWKVYNLSRNASRDDRVINIAVDVEKAGSVNLAMGELLYKEPKIDVLIYSAGYSMAAPVEHVRQKDVETLFKVNYFGALKIAQKIIPAMRKSGGGRMIFISSMASKLPVAFDSYYSSSKAALDMLAKGLALELEPYNIKVTSVQPGGTSTRFTYKRNVYEPQNVGDYADRLNKAVKTLEKIEQEGMTPVAVAEEIVRVVQMKNPPATYACGIKNKTYKVMQKLLPERLVDYLNKQQYTTDQS